MKKQWLHNCLHYSALEADLYSGCRKILRNVSMDLGSLHRDPIKLQDAGYTKSKLTLLTNHYLHEESRDVALQLWARRLEAKKYGSVSFTTFGHFVKGKGSVDEIAAKKSKRASIFGPCIQSVVLTWVKKDKMAVDVFYRTTEIFKKFPADMVLLRDVLLPPFDLPDTTVVNAHFANVTCHPMYFVTLIPELDDPIKELDRLKKVDRFFYDWIIKWTGRYICPEHHRGIAKFAQSLRVQKDAYERLDKTTLKEMQKYIRKNHPGYRNDYNDEEDEE